MGRDLFLRPGDERSSSSESFASATGASAFLTRLVSFGLDVRALNVVRISYKDFEAR
jgi:hypothetical protein